jgi:hypothetical protein
MAGGLEPGIVAQSSWISACPVFLAIFDSPVEEGRGVLRCSRACRRRAELRHRGRSRRQGGPAKGIACKAGEFIWREAGSRHAAWCPEGALILAIFQVPNKFFESDGRVVDAAGQDWDENWGHTDAQPARRTQ